MNILGIDIGGSGIKASLVNAETGELVGDRVRLDSPDGFLPDDVIIAVTDLVKQFQHNGPVGIGFPTVVIDGVVMTPPIALSVTEWIGYPIAAKLRETTSCETTVINDADAAGTAEMSFGAGRGAKGVTMVFTIGTGIGSALFLDGRLVPNLELGHLFLPGKKKDAEHQASDRARKGKDLTWEKWGDNLNTYFRHIEHLFSPQLIIIGGGVSRKFEKFAPHIQVRAKMIQAGLLNDAGIIGAAMSVPAISVVPATGRKTRTRKLPTDENGTDKK